MGIFGRLFKRKKTPAPRKKKTKYGHPHGHPHNMLSKKRADYHKKTRLTLRIEPQIKQEMTLYVQKRGLTISQLTQDLYIGLLYGKTYTRLKKIMVKQQVSD